jgi:hypothetical protein
MSVRPETYKIVIIIFYLSLWTKYLFRQNFAEEKIFASTKYRQRKNIGIAKISATTKYRCRQKMAKKKYRHRKNIGFDNISVEIKVARYQNGGN